MGIWQLWFSIVWELRPACARQRTFFWMVVVLAGFCVRRRADAVTGLARSAGISEKFYDRMLDLFHSPALNVPMLTRIWTSVVFRYHPGVVRVAGRHVLIADGIKAPRSGKKMPANKRLHQESESNTKPASILGHSCQAVMALVQSLSGYQALPLSCRIHEGLRTSTRDRCSILDKLIILVDELVLNQAVYIVADAFYASGKLIKKLRENNHHLITRGKKGFTAYLPAPAAGERGRGRPRTYGDKVKVADVAYLPNAHTESFSSPIRGEEGTIITVWYADLLWRPSGELVRFVIAPGKKRPSIVLMSTDTSLSPKDIVFLYALRYKIEISFKQTVHTIGTFAYHFWMAAMKPITSAGKTQYLHRASEAYRKAVHRKMAAYHRHMQLGFIAHGILIIIASLKPDHVWASFRSWLRTSNKALPPSEYVVASALAHTFPDFLVAAEKHNDFAIFLSKRIDACAAACLHHAA